MRQRIGLAQALLHKPEVLILDEPTIGLDPAQVVEVRNIIRDIGKERTVLLSTHILSEAQQLCDRVLIINKGRIVAEDTPENLQARLVGAERSILRIKGDAGGTHVLRLPKLNGVQDIKIRSDGALEFQFAPGVDVRPEVAKTVIMSGYDLLRTQSNRTKSGRNFPGTYTRWRVHQEGAVEMRNVWTIARREIRLFFASPVAYIIGLLILLITGIYFVLVIYLAGQSAFTSGSASSTRSRFSYRANGIPIPVCGPSVIHASNG